MLITVAILLYYNYKPSYGLAALTAVGRIVGCMIALGIEIVILIVIFIIHEIFD